MTSTLRKGLPVISIFAGLCLSSVLTAAPTASITTPVNLTLSNLYTTQSGSDDVIVRGSAGGIMPLTWSLDYKLTTNPSWTNIATGSAPVTNGVLGTWSTLDRPDGTFNKNGAYQLRLHVCDASGACVDAIVNDTVGNCYVIQTDPADPNETAVVRQINVGLGQKIRYVAYMPLWQVNVTLSVKKADLTFVKSIGTGTSSGKFIYDWDGTNTGGSKVADAPYFVSAGFTDGTNSFTWDQTSQYLAPGIQWTYYDQNQTWDPWTGDPLNLTYNFGTGRVSIAMSTGSSNEIDGTCPPPQGFCIVDHKYEESGSHTVRWVGVDPTGKYRKDVKWIAMVSETNLFSKNAVVTYGTKPAISNLQVGGRIVKTMSPQTVSFNVAFTSPWTAQVKITNQESGTLLRTLSGAGQCINGNCVISWDGKADSGMWVAPGGYTVTATVTDAIGNVVSDQALTYIQY